MNTFFRRSLTGAVAALSLGAMVAATATPAAARWNGYGHRGWGGGAVAAGVIGGLALGALAAGAARPAYAEPVYGPPVYGAPAYVEPEVSYAPPVAYEAVPAYGPAYGYGCHRVWAPVHRADGGYVRDRLVRVCD